MNTLRDVEIGKTVSVLKLHGEGAIKRRIMDMGITKGTDIYVRKVAPLGDPIEVTVRGYELSIRKADAEMIEVYQTTLKNNKSSEKAEYWTDLGEFYARMTEIITLVLQRLKNPEERKRITSVNDMLIKLKSNPTLLKLFNTLPQQYHATVINTLKSILTRVFATLI
jgi:ferrous iron transport protein A